MKALPLLQQLKITLDASTTGLEPNWRYIKKEIDNVLGFYSQPFSPEKHLVGEERLFEGWELSETKHLIKYCSPLPPYLLICFIKNGSSEYYFEHFDSETILAQFKMPKTLHQFMSDCERAGIELEWSDKAKEALK